MTSRLEAVRERARQHKVRPSKPRRFLPKGMALTEFFEVLERRGVSYAVLRWFETLPHVEPGEDVDLLVADEDIDVVHELLLQEEPPNGGQKFDVYSVSGLPGSDFRGIAYYPPRFARAILADATRLHGLYRVPSTKHHLDSLAYHAVYHKGYASGLDHGTSSGRQRERSDHDYEHALGKLAAELGTQVTLTLPGLDDYLAGEGLRPPPDTLERLQARNPWITEHFFRDLPPVDPVWHGLAVFVLRDRAEHLVDVATRELAAEGFELLEVVHLDPEQRETATHRMRGGNWGPGPWPESGGGPNTYLVVYDVIPTLGPDDDGSATNLRVPRAKEVLRARLLAGVDATGTYNPVHSSDNPRQALDYVDILGDPDLVGRLRSVAEGLHDLVRQPFPVVETFLTETRRAQVAVVDHPVHGHAVCKVFRPGASRYFQRELCARTLIADLPEMPELLDSGENWLLTRLYRDDRSHLLRRLPGQRDHQLRPEVSRRLAAFAVALNERGRFMLDLCVPNVLCDPVHGLKVLDLEFLHEYLDEVPPPARSYTLRGIPAGTPGYDRPRHGPGKLTWHGSRNTAFHPAVTGMPVEHLLRPPRRGEDVLRRGVQLAWYLYHLSRITYGRTRGSLSRTRTGQRYRTVRWLLTGQEKRRLR